jgi:hypothetical protein
VRALLTGQDDTTLHPYKKWDGAHWRLVQLVELEATQDKRVPEAMNRVLDWMTSIQPRAIDGLTRVHALARDLVRWQWPDGGWNCDPKATGRRSSFHESLIPMHGLYEYGEHQAASRTAELLLDHRLYRSKTTGEPIHESWTKLRHPPDWHYNILYALTVLTRVGLSGDPRAGDALEMLRRRRFRRGGNEMVTLNALRVLYAVSR